MTKLECLQLITDCKAILYKSVGKLGFHKMLMLANLNAYNDAITDAERMVYDKYLHDAEQACTLQNAISCISDARSAYTEYCKELGIQECERSSIDSIFVKRMLDLQQCKDNAKQEADGVNIVIHLDLTSEDDVMYVCKQLDKLLSRLIVDGKLKRDSNNL